MEPIKAHFLHPTQKVIVERNGKYISDTVMSAPLNEFVGAVFLTTSGVVGSDSKFYLDTKLTRTYLLLKGIDIHEK